MKPNLLTGMFLKLATLAFAVSLIAPLAVEADATPPLTKSDVKALIKTASTPADHLKIAGYYRVQAARFRANAAEHQKMMAENHTSHPGKVWSATRVNHCQFMVQDYTDRAKKADALAILHEQMAVQAKAALSR